MQLKPLFLIEAMGRLAALVARQRQLCRVDNAQLIHHGCSIQLQRQADAMQLKPLFLIEAMSLLAALLAR